MMEVTYLFWLLAAMTVIAFLTLVGNPIMSAALKAWAWIKPASKTNGTVIGIQNVLGIGQKYTQYASLHGCLYTLRLIDFETPALDIAEELTSIDSKAAVAFKAQANTAV